jgi:flagellar biosynthesis/type III secretory pathway M-ring protein FliF/YscJ
MMWDWIKDKWELLVSAFVVLTVFVLGRKSKEKQIQVAEASATAKEKETEVIKEVTAEEKLRLARVNKKYIQSRTALRRQHRQSETELQRETVNRKLELLELAKEDPDAIDRILMEEYNIAKLK